MTAINDLWYNENVYYLKTDLEKYIITPLAALSHLPSIDIENNEDWIKKVNNGMKLSPHVLDVEAELLVVKCGNSLKAIYKFNSEKNKNTLFVVKGNPRGDEGLDNGIFRSFKKYDENCVNCITYNKFKQI